MWQNDYDQRLYYTCSGRDSISMITSKHDNGREDRVWDFSCKQSFDSFYRMLLVSLCQLV
uniref:Uncharacterized protein n=1 Tax=Anguilla anguilla TaxID=7936 RepID=A0A0E9RZ99_ANGAN